MKEIPVPQTEEARARQDRRLRRLTVALNAIFYCFVAVSVLGLAGVVVTVMVDELGSGLSAGLLFSLVGGMGGGAVLGALAAFFFGRLIVFAHDRRVDWLERCDGEDSFSVGEGTFATFGADGVTFHGENPRQKSAAHIFVPYREMRLFSVCTRRAPKEKGEWSVVFEAPARYFAKEKRDDLAPILIQTDAKPRLYAAVERYGLTLSGELPANGAPNGKFVRKARYTLVHRERRRNALIFIGVGVALAAGGAVTAVWQTLIGSVLLVAGGVVAVRGASSLRSAKAALELYPEGVFWRDGAERVFVKWIELEKIERAEERGEPVLRMSCPYGAYHFPELGDSFEQASALHRAALQGTEKPAALSE